MGHRNREIELKLMVPGTFEEVCSTLQLLLSDHQPIVRLGTSVDTYWHINNPDVDADFLRVRERDGIRQITVKGKDRGDNINRIEVDIDSTSETHRIHRLVRCALGKPAGVISKTYKVWELESEYDTVCAYQLSTPVTSGVFIEVEARSEDRMRELERLVRVAYTEAAPAPGSLYEMFVTPAPRK